MDVEMERDEKEILEEKAAELELRVAELEGDIALYVEGKEDGASGGDEMKLVVDQNEKLKDALQRLHEATLVQQNRIKELERDNKTIDALQAEVTSLTKKSKKVDTLTTEVEQLQEALEEASEFGEFAEELTEKNLKLSEQIAELQEQVDFFEEMKEAADEVEQAQIEEIRELTVELDQKEALEQNSIVALQQMKSQLEESDHTMEQLRAALKASSNKLSEQSNDPPAQIAQVDEQELLARKFELQKQAEDAATHKLELQLLRAETEILRTRQACYTAMVNTDEDLKSIEALTSLMSLSCKGEVVEMYLREQASALAAAGDLSQLQRCVTVHSKIADSIQIAGTIFDAMRGSEEVFLKLGQRQRDIELILANLEPVLCNIKDDQIPELSLVDEIVQKLAAVQSSEGLTVHRHPPSIVASTMYKLAAASCLLNAVGNEVGSLGSSAAVSVGCKTLTAHAQLITKAVDRVLQKGKDTWKTICLDDVQTNSLLGALSVVETQIQQLTASLADSRADASKLEDLLTAIGIDSQAGKVLEDSPPDCMDAQLDACVGKLRVVSNHITEGAGKAVELSTAAWVTRGTALSEAVACSTQFSDKHAAAEEELKTCKTAMKRAEKDLEDANAKLQVLSKRLEDKTNEIVGFKSKVQELSKQEETYQKAMDVLQDSLQEQVNKKNAAHEKLNTLEAEMVTRALTVAPTSGQPMEANVSFGTADSSTLQLTVQSLWKMNQKLRAKLMSKRVSEFPVEPAHKPHNSIASQLSDSVHVLQRDATSLMAMPKVVSLAKGPCDGSPVETWRQANAEVFKVQYRCQELKAQLQHQYLKSHPGSASNTSFGIFPRQHVAAQVFREPSMTRVARVVLDDQRSSCSQQKVQMSSSEFSAFHKALVAT
eukprot:TRINITY_DN11422_c0_g1_i3.p1 TRINITY_DN11422_c0_g1~~TRINITY_DN11422_c0_g1_i3.p1  ORF type:complete len:887 (+),score=220.76 TRINITY_DN11422_c0_g1_i3:200-2860(+)